MSLTTLLSRKSRFALGLAGILLASPVACGQNNGTQEPTYGDTTGATTNNTSNGTPHGDTVDGGSNYPSGDTADSSSGNPGNSDGGSDSSEDDYYEEDYSTSTFFIDDPDPISLAASSGSWSYDVAIGADYGSCPVHSCLTTPGERQTNAVTVLAAVYVVVKDGIRAVSNLDSRVTRDIAELNSAYSAINVDFNSSHYRITEITDHPEWWDVTGAEFGTLINSVKNDDSQPWWPMVYVRTINGGNHAGEAYQCSNRGIVLARAATAQTAAHEFGHQMCLYHTQERSCGEEACEGSGCDTTGDFICDTLADRTYESCEGSGCSKTCGGCVAPTDNTMSYHGACREGFSDTQLNVMKCWLNSW